MGEDQQSEDEGWQGRVEGFLKEVQKLADFPKYLMIVDGKKSFMSLQQAGITFDSGFVRVEIGSLVLEEDFSVRDITPVEEKEISRIADEYSASK